MAIIALACAPMDLTPFIRDVPNFPKPGIIFKDITPLLGNAQALTFAVDAIAHAHVGKGITKVVGIESRGFILAPPVALALGVGFVPIRKPGKLPWKAIRESYNLEYGNDAVEIHEDSITSADAPGYRTVTVTIGSSIFGYSRTDSRLKLTAPTSNTSRDSTVANTGRRMEISASCMA